MDDWSPQETEQNTHLRVTGTPGVRKRGFYQPVPHPSWDEGDFLGHQLPDISCLLCAWAELAPINRVTSVYRRQPLAGRGECPGDMGGPPSAFATDFIFLLPFGEEGSVLGTPAPVCCLHSPGSPFCGHPVLRLCPLTPGRVMPAQKPLITPGSLRLLYFNNVLEQKIHLHESNFKGHGIVDGILKQKKGH